MAFRGPVVNRNESCGLVLIHRHMGDTENEEYHDLELEKLGGWDSVDESWTNAIRDGLSEL